LGRRRRRRDDQLLNLALFLLILAVIFYFAFKYGVDDIFFLGITVGFIVTFLWRPVYCRSPLLFLVAFKDQEKRAERELNFSEKEFILLSDKRIKG